MDAYSLQFECNSIMYVACSNTHSFIEAIKGRSSIYMYKISFDVGIVANTAKDVKLTSNHIEVTLSCTVALFLGLGIRE